MEWRNLLRPFARKARLGALGAFLVLALAASSGNAGPDQPPTCHGMPATVVGTSGDDVYPVFSEFPDGSVIALRGGDDRVTAPQGRNLTVCLGGGSDYWRVPDRPTGQSTLLDGESGKDFIGDLGEDDEFASPIRLIGGPGNDVAIGGSERDRIDGDSGSDRLTGNEGGDQVRGGRDADELLGGGNGDALFGGGGDDSIWSDTPGQKDGRDKADGGNGFDRCDAEVERRCEAKSE